MRSSARRRTVHIDSPARKCLYCLSDVGPFVSEEHVIPRGLGSNADQYVIPPGGVCDPCNKWLGAQVDNPFLGRFDMRLTRGLERLRGRNGKWPEMIEGLNPTAKMDLDLDGARVTIYPSSVIKTEDGGLDIELRPTVPDPADVVARTIRALWKIALGCIWLRSSSEGLDPRWDHLRHAILGTPFKGYLLQKPFTAVTTRRIDIDLSLREPESPTAMVFAVGGVVLAVPIAQGSTVAHADAVRAGWEVHSTEGLAPRTIRLRLEPSGVERS